MSRNITCKSSSKSTLKPALSMAPSTLTPKAEQGRSQSNLRASRYFNLLTSRQVPQKAALSTSLLPPFKKVKDLRGKGVSSQGRAKKLRNFELEESPVKN